MEKRVINPCTWQDNYGFVQANEITNPRRILVTAGQVSVDKNGALLHPGDMKKQLEQVLDNIELILKEGDFKLEDVIRFTYFTTDVAAFSTAAPEKLIPRLSEANCKPATSLIGVNELFHPECVVEIEATVAA